MTPVLSGALTAAAPAATSAAVAAARSIIVASLSPLAVGEREVAKHGGPDQKRDHRHRDRRTLPELAARDRALVGEGRHQVRRVDGPAAGDGVDELEVG